MPQEVRRERKVVTVLFCDLVGFTSRAEEMDPEDVAALLGPYHARVKAELERHGGTVEKFIGDAVMALFGAPVAHEDDPERAVRAALAVRRFAEEDGLELRIGVTTGEALVTIGARPDEGETMATGDVVNTAARLQAAAHANGVLVGEKTYEATRDAIAYDEAEPVEAKGKARPISVWEALRARARVGLERPHETAFIGRSQELALLEAALTRARQERACQLVTVVGVPGIGKSRLVYELSQAVDRDPELISWRQGRCLPYGDGVTFWALGEIVKAQAGIVETDSTAEAERKLQAVVGDPWVESQLRPLVGLTGEQELGDDRRGEAFAAWRRFLEELAERRPLVAVVEDLHWADESLLDFVDYLVDWATGVPLLVVCTARPELLERRPGWGGGTPNALTLSLSPLTDDDTARLVGGLLEQRLLPAETQAALLARAGGNPLYAEQFARMLEERGDVDELPLPETVQGIIAARLDGLDAEQKSLLQDAAVLGEVFPLAGLARVTGADVTELEQRLHALERREFVRRERQQADADVEYAFRHILVRDVAYGQIPRPERGEKHRRAAEWIESLGRADDNAEMLAYHYLEALELTRAAGLDFAGTLEPARLACRAAGDRALALGAYAAAERFYAAALPIWPPDDGLGRARLLLGRAQAVIAFEPERIDVVIEARDALLAAGDVESAVEAETELCSLLWYEGRRDAAYEAADRALALSVGRPRSAARAHALATRARNFTVAGESATAIETGREAMAIAESLGLDRLYATALRAVGSSRLRLGDEAGMDDVERSLEISRSIPAPDEAQRAYTAITNARWESGELDKAAAAIAATREWCDRFPLVRAVQWLAGVEAIHSYKAGDWNDAGRRAEAFLAALGSGSHYLEAPARYLRAYVRLARDDIDGADSDTELALRLAREAKDSQSLVPTLAARVRALDRTEASDAVVTELMDEALAGVDGCPLHWLVDVAWASVASGREAPFSVQLERIPQRSPWVDAAREIVGYRYDSAAEVLRSMGALGEEAYARLHAAESLVRAGRHADADVQLRPALSFFRSQGATGYARAAEELLAAAS